MWNITINFAEGGGVQIDYVISWLPLVFQHPLEHFIMDKWYTDI